MSWRDRSVPTAQRGEESARRERKDGDRGRIPESGMPDRFWKAIEAECARAYGRDTGKEVLRVLRLAEFDDALFAETVLGFTQPGGWLPWQHEVWQRLHEKPYCTASGSNSIGKTTSLVLMHLRAGLYREWAPPWWDVYEALHHGPLEEHALQVRTKMLQVLRGEAREQAQRVKGGYKYRPCLVEPFVRAVKADDGKHEAMEFYEGWSKLIFRSTAFKAKGSDGSAPHFITEDETRYEQNLLHVVNFVFIPRFLRAEGGRLYLPITHLEASVEAVALIQKGLEGDPDWSHVSTDLERDNPTVGKKTREQVARNIGKRARRQAIGGQAIQPLGAVFSHDATRSAFFGSTEPEWLGDLAGARGRAEARCVVCKERRETRSALWSKAAIDHDRHLIVGFVDPASSAQKDAIAATAWDLEPYGYAERGAEVIYVEELDPGTRIQDVARHMERMAHELRGEVGYDRQGPLGYNVRDLLVDLDPECEFVEVAWNEGGEKDAALAFFKGLIDGNFWRCPEHLATRSQITNYIRRDARIPTDFLMAQVGCAQVARPYLSDSVLEAARVEGDAAVVSYTDALPLAAAPAEEPDPFDAEEAMFGILGIEADESAYAGAET